MLLIMGLGERFFRINLQRRSICLDGFPAIHRRDAGIGHLHLARQARIVPERHLRIGHLAGFLQHQQLARVSHLQRLERLDHVNAQAARVHL